MVEIKIDMRKSLEENAGDYFEKAKKAKKKMEGAKAALEKAKTRIKELVEKQLKEEYPMAEVEPQQHRREKRLGKAWYENFRWFFSSEGFLVVGGRDATTNEIIVKKHMEKNDVVFHTDMAGSPFFVVKAKGKQPTDITLQEVANATFSFSRAVKLGLTTANVFWVTPAQVFKEAQSGEYLSKGAFMIRGKTNYMYPSFDLGIGLTNDSVDISLGPNKIMCGPKAAVKKHCNAWLALELSGDEKPSDVAKAIRRKLGGGDLDEIFRTLPGVGVRVKG